MDIAMFIAQDNPKRALSFADELEDKCDVLGGAPGRQQVAAPTKAR